MNEIAYTRLTIGILVAVLITGCATGSVKENHMEDAKIAVNQNDIPTAYAYFESHIERLSSSPEQDLLQVRSYFEKNPSLGSYGHSIFTSENLYKEIEGHGKRVAKKIIDNRLSFYRKVASSSEFEAASKCVSEVFEGIRGGCGRELNYGTIVDAQTVDKSYKNTGAGAQLGSVYGQAGYIDSTSIYDYSATGQVNSAIVGGLVGALLLDRPSEQRFDTTYFVLTNSGETITFKRVSKEPLRLPAGSCVEFREPNYLELTNRRNCSESN